MTIFGCNLESYTHTHTKHDIGPRCTKVKQRTNHVAIYLLINRCAAHIKIKMTVSAHGGLNGLCIIHTKLLEYVISVLSLTYKCPIFDLLDLKSKKQREFTHHGHLKSNGHNLVKLITKKIY
jgi:hypothetical protein